MMYRIYWTMKGPGGTIEVPNTEPELDVPTVEDVIVALHGRKLPGGQFGLECVGLRIIREDVDGTRTEAGR